MYITETWYKYPLNVSLRDKGRWHGLGHFDTKAYFLVNFALEGKCQIWQRVLYRLLVWGLTSRYAKNVEPWRYIVISLINLFKIEETTLIARFMGPTWAHLGPTGPRWAPCWPHEPCYLGMKAKQDWNDTIDKTKWTKIYVCSQNQNDNNSRNARQNPIHSQQRQRQCG